jgi:hypothetical protein
MKFAIPLLHTCNRISPIIVLTILVNYNVPMMNAVIGGYIMNATVHVDIFLRSSRLAKMSSTGLVLNVEFTL